MKSFWDRFLANFPQMFQPFGPGILLAQNLLVLGLSNTSHQESNISFVFPFASLWLLKILLNGSLWFLFLHLFFFCFCVVCFIFWLHWNCLKLNWEIGGVFLKFFNKLLTRFFMVSFLFMLLYFAWGHLVKLIFFCFWFL